METQTERTLVSARPTGSDELSKLIEQYGCGPVEFTGTNDALYERHLVFDNVMDAAAIGARERFEALARSVRDVLSQRWIRTEETYDHKDPKRVYYLSMEFLIGRSLANNVTNLLLDDIIKEDIQEKKINWYELLEQEPDVVMACCGDVPTLETLAAVDLLRHYAPDLKVRVINVVNLMKLQPQTEHPHGLSDHDFDALFTTDKPIVFAFHGYPWLIHRLTYRRAGHRNLHVRGYKEEGTTSTPFDMCVLNDLDRFHLVSDVIDRVPKLGARAAYAKQAIRDKLIEHKEFICRHGDDMPEITDWKWGGHAKASKGSPSTEADNV